MAGPMVRVDMLKVGGTVNASPVPFELSKPRAGNTRPNPRKRLPQITVQPAQAPGGAGYV
jgi:hypothetical protein